MAADILVENHSGLFMITPVSEAAQEFIADNVHTDNWQWQGASFAVDDRQQAMDICQAALDDGLTVE